VLNGPDVRDQRGISAYFVQMGQFIDHDITLSPAFEKECCDEDDDGRNWKFPSSNKDPDRCSPIQVLRACTQMTTSA